MKKLYGLAACLCMFLLMSFSFFTREKVPDSLSIVGDILQEAAKTLKKKYNMRPVATNIAMPDGIVKLFGVDFEIDRGPLSKEQIREILVHAAQDFIVIVRKNKAIEPYLETCPFEIKDIDIVLFINDPKGYWVQHPHIGTASISGAMLEYYTIARRRNLASEFSVSVPFNKTEEKETYEEALISLGEEPK